MQARYLPGHYRPLTAIATRYIMDIVDIVADYGDRVICEGTHKKSDLIRAFGRALSEIAPDAHNAIFDDADYMLIHQALLHGNTYDVDYGTMCEVADNLLENLDVELGAHAPDGYYFGTPEGDGACFGFWSFDDFSD